MDTLEMLVRCVVNGWPVTLFVVGLLVKTCWEGAMFAFLPEQAGCWAAIAVSAAYVLFIGLHELGHLVMPWYGIILAAASVLAWVMAARSELSVGYITEFKRALIVRYIGGACCLVAYALLRLEREPAWGFVLGLSLLGLVGVSLLIASRVQLTVLVHRSNRA